MTKQLTTQNATITTASIQVQAMTIGARQVTLSVFRQLIEEPLIAHDGTLNGVPWGAVNYHPDKCGDDRRKHWHVVWQRGEELRRAFVTQMPRFDPDGDMRRVPAEFTTKEASLLLASSVLGWLTGKTLECPLRKEEYAANYSSYVDYDSGHGFSVPAIASPLTITAANKRAEAERIFKWSTKAPPSSLGHTQERLQAAREASDQATTNLRAEVRALGRSHQQHLDAFRDACHQEAARRQRHRDARAALAELPQLFIAV